MSVDEFKKMVAALRAMYPKAGAWDNEIQLSIWYGVARDIPADIGIRFVSDYAKENKFPPTLADFNSYCVTKIAPAVKDAMEAWGDVKKSIGHYGYMREEEALASLDEITRSVVKDMGYFSICNSEQDDMPILFAQFRNTYEARVKRTEGERMAEALLEIAKRKKLGESEQEKIERRD